MKNILKIFIILLISTITLQANAQTLGIKAGFNLANMKETVDATTFSIDTKMKAGFHVGLMYDIPIKTYLSFEPALLFTTKGLKIKENILGVVLDASLNLYYIDIPLNLKGNFNIGEETNVYVAFGPYLGFGLSGKSKVYASYLGQSESSEENVIWGNDPNNDYLKRFDFGLTFGAGIEFKKYMFGISYDLGLTNISAYQEDDTSLKNRVLKFSLGYRFIN